jgi:hypothetical protein
MLSPASKDTVFMNPTIFVPKLNNRSKFCENKLDSNNKNRIFKKNGFLKLIEMSNKSIADMRQTSKYKYEVRDSFMMQK